MGGVMDALARTALPAALTAGLFPSLAPHDQILEGSLTYSPDGLRHAYTVGDGGKMRVVVDGAEGSEYQDAGRPVFSPDSRRTAYAAVRQDKPVVVVDNAEVAAPGRVIP